MRITATIIPILAAGLLAACASQTPAQKAAATACLMDAAGAVLAVVPGTMDAAGNVSARTAVPAAGSVLKTALNDPNCAAAMLAAEAPAKPH